MLLTTPILIALVIISFVGWQVGLWMIFKKAGLAPLEIRYPILQYLALDA